VVKIDNRVRAAQRVRYLLGFVTQQHGLERRKQLVSHFAP
jgi:hypothetical protein